VKLDACSLGEVGAISCPVAGRAHKGARRRSPDTPQYDPLINSDPSRALHARAWEGNALGGVDDLGLGVSVKGEPAGLGTRGHRPHPW
jgi:hypothetical protein